MKRIVICCDGTWNTGEQRNPTNVVKTYEAVLPRAPDGTVQDRYYHPGVGTLSLIDRLPGGVFGAGLWKNVQETYRYIVDTYEAGDELFFFGFSRGAYTVRSTVGMIRNCGILRRDRSEPERRKLIEEAYNHYRSKLKPDAPATEMFRSKNCVPFPDGLFKDVPSVKFVGVWDTVGALGIPVGLLGTIWNRRYRFHDVSLSRIVENAYHALAIDEKRGSFRPTLWEQHPYAKDQKLEQRWFAGVHTNVGGGSPDSFQSDWTLRWIIGKAQECDLAFDEGYVESQIEDDPDGWISESRKGLWRWLSSLSRPIGKGVPPKETTYLAGTSNEVVDPAVVARNVRDPSYMPLNLVAYFRENPSALGAARKSREGAHAGRNGTALGGGPGQVVGDDP